MNKNIETPEYSRFNPYDDLSPREYRGLVSAINKNNIIDLTSTFDNFPTDYSNLCIVAIGSDGKLERHPQSRTEFVFIQKNRVAFDLLSRFSSWYVNNYGVPFHTKFEHNPRTQLPDLKTIDDNIPLSYAYGDEERIFPDTTLNGYPVLGNEEILLAAKRQVLLESTQENELGKKIRTRMKHKQLSENEKGLKTGKYGKYITYRLDPPLQFYNEDPNNYTLGFKNTALRSIQRFADITTIQAIRDNHLTIEDAIHFSTTTPERLDSLVQRNLLPENLKLAEAYDWFLQQYHAVQESYQIAKVPVSMPFDSDKFAMHKEAIDRSLALIKGKTF